MNANIVLLIVIAVLVIALLFWLYAASRRTRVEGEPPAEAAPARRNQALIDAPPVAAMPTAPPPVSAPTVAPAPVGAPASPAAPAAAASPPAGQHDDLTRLKGVGPKLAEQLNALGVFRFAQVAAWDEADIDRIDAQLGRFQGRIRRDDWREQARLLAAGNTAAYEARFGKL